MKHTVATAHVGVDSSVVSKVVVTSSSAITLSLSLSFVNRMVLSITIKSHLIGTSGGMFFFFFLVKWWDVIIPGSLFS